MSYPILVHIANQTNSMPSRIVQTIMHHTTQVRDNVCLIYRVHSPSLNHVLSESVHYKTQIGMLLTRYINDSMGWWYNVRSTKSLLKALSFFQLVIISVYIGNYDHDPSKPLAPKNKASSQYLSSQTMKQDLTCTLEWVLMYLRWTNNQHRAKE